MRIFSQKSVKPSIGWEEKTIHPIKHLRLELIEALGIFLKVSAVVLPITLGIKALL